MKTASDTIKEMKKQSKNKRFKIMKEKFESGDLEAVTGDKISLANHFFLIPEYIAKHKYLTPATKLVFGCIMFHAQREKHACFPGKNLISRETGLSLKTVYNSLQQLLGLNEVNEIFLTVIHRGHGLTNLYKLFFKMDGETLQSVKEKMKSKIGKNYRSKKKTSK